MRHRMKRPSKKHRVIAKDTERRRAKQIRQETNRHEVVTTRHIGACGALYGKECSCERDHTERTE